MDFKERLECIMFVEIIITRLISKLSLVYACKLPCDAFGFATFVFGFASSGQALKTIFRLEIILLEKT